MTDPISDMLTRIRNALVMKKTEVVLPYSKLKENFANLIERQGWIEKVEVSEQKNHKFLRVGLRYSPEGKAVISGLKRISKPGQRIYARAAEIPRFGMGMGATIISTSKGLMTHSEARKAKVGGEVICQIW